MQDQSDLDVYAGEEAAADPAAGVQPPPSPPGTTRQSDQIVGLEPTCIGLSRWAVWLGPCIYACLTTLQGGEDLLPCQETASAACGRSVEVCSGVGGSAGCKRCLA